MKKLVSIIMLSTFLTLQTSNSSAMHRHPDDTCCSRVMRAMNPKNLLFFLGLILVVLNGEIQSATAYSEKDMRYILQRPPEWHMQLVCQPFPEGFKKHGHIYITPKGYTHLTLSKSNSDETYDFEKSYAGCWNLIGQFAKKHGIKNLGKARQKLFDMCPPFKTIYDIYKADTPHDEL